MKENQQSSSEIKPTFQASKNAFKQTIEKIQLTALKEVLEKKRIESIKNRLKQEWLERKKIISPHISPADRENLFRTTDSFSSKDTDCFRIHKHNCFKKDDFLGDQELLFQKRTYQLMVSNAEFSRKQLPQRQSYAAASTGFQKYRMDQLKQRKFKESWKHSYRKDEMNVMRFSSAANSSEAKFLKTGELGRTLYTLVPPIEKNTFSPQYAKMNVCEKTYHEFEEENKENNETKVEEKKEDKKYRLYVKKNKTSLIVKKQLLQ